MPRIAIIDDDPDIIETVSTILKKQGFDVISASDANEGEKIILEQNPDLAILDVMMEEPDDGFFLARRLKKKGYSNPIILLTSISKTLGFDYDKSEIVDVSEFLEKPISPEALILTIEQTLRKGG